MSEEGMREPSSAAEEILENLYRIEEEKEAGLAVGPDEPGVDESVAAADVVRSDGGLRLTAAGRAKGRSVVRRHRLAERLLHDVLLDPAASLHRDGCRFEHVLQHGLEDRVCLLLGHPRTCPHGRPIPEGECCRLARRDSIREVAPLCDGHPGARGTVVYLAARDSGEVRKMMAMGILPGTSIRMIQRFPSYVFECGRSQFAVDRPLAETVFVHWQGE